MLIKIYDKTGKLKAELSPENSSTQVKEIQGDNVLSLSFTLPRHIALDVDDYADFMWERYRLTKQYRPKQKSTVEWAYNLKMYGVESLIKNFLVIKSVDGDNEPVFTLTASPREHLALIVKCINDGFGTNDWKVGKVEGTDNIVIDYRGKYCDGALRELAEKTGQEYWAEGTTVNLCRCEHGEPVTLGYDKGLTSLDCGDADNVKFYTRLFPVGSSKNIDQTKYGSARLRLPGGLRYVEVNADKYSRVDHYEESAFADIYPRYTGTVSSVRSEERTDKNGDKFTVYYFKDDGLPFDPNEYEIGGLVKRVSFQEGSELAGLGDEDNGTYYFEVNFNSDTREFEIITIWPYDDGTQLPGATLVPKPGDRYIPWNIRMPDEYYALAEAELLAAVNEYNAEHALDVAVYKAPTDHVWIEQNNVVLTVGRRVRLESEKYFPGIGYRDSRITRITRKVNLPSQMDLEIGDALSRRTLDKVQDNITSIKNYVESGKAGLPDIIGTGDNTPFTDTNILSALRTIKEIAKRALSRLHDDEAAGLIKFLAGLEVGTYKEGLSGAKIDADGNAIFVELLTRLKATLAQLQVNGASEFRGQLSSEDFISGFIGGKGWAIIKREVLNALGVPETKYTAEFDDIVVRGALRVFTMVISQLLGENDNRIFTGMMEVDHYDPATGRVYLQTHNGKFYNPFRVDDYIMVQQYNGLPSEDNAHYITKHYELIVTAAGCGDQSAGEDRLDWVEFKNFVAADGRVATDVISKGDTFTRVDNATDADRKGLIQIITVGTAAPYMDIVYGMKTDPDNSLKGRLGNLKGIHHHLFGWLDGFGELLTNLYAVGDFRLRRTGESLDSKIEMLRGVFESRFRSLTHDITEDDNYLTNPAFAEQMAGWIGMDDGSIITSNGEALLINGNTFVSDGRIAKVEEYDGKGMLHLKRSGVRQNNALIRQPGTHREYVPPTPNDMTAQYRDVKDTLYLSVKILAISDGVLEVGFADSTAEPGSLPAPAVATVSASGEWQTLQWQGTWDGKGDFIVEFTGEAYISLLSLTDRALDDFKQEVSTSIEQTSEYIRLLGENIDTVNGTVTQLGLDIDAANKEIRAYVQQTANDIEGVRSDISQLQITADGINSSVVKVAGDLNAAKKAADAAIAEAQRVADEALTESNRAFEQAMINAGIITSHATIIDQTADRIAFVAGLFNENGHLLEGSSWVLASDYQVMQTELGDVKAKVATSVQYNPATKEITSDIKLSADKIYITGKTTINQLFQIEADGTAHIGMFVIDENGLHNEVDPNNVASLYPGKFMLKRCYSYAGNEFARIECNMGDDANPTSTLYPGSMAAYFYRRFVSGIGDMYTPAVLIRSDNNSVINVGLQVDGGLRVNGGVIECGREIAITSASSSNIIDVSMGTTIVVRNTYSDSGAVYLPTRAQLCQQAGRSSSDAFAVPVTIVNSRYSTHNVYLTVQSSSDGGQIVDNNANELSGSKVIMGKGDSFVALLVNCSSGYYIQRVSNQN